MGVIGHDDAGQQRERAVVQFHRHAFQSLQGRGDFQQLQNDGLVFAQHVAGSNAEQQGIADLASCAGNGDAYGLFHSGTPGER